VCFNDNLDTIPRQSVVTPFEDFEMLQNVEKFLLNLKDSSVQVSANTGSYPEAGAASVRLVFSEGSELRADYWRLARDGKAKISRFDHQQQYGLPAPLDAIKELQHELQNKIVSDTNLDTETGDILFQFTGNVKVQIFNFTGYEVWEIQFPDGTREFSNFIRRLHPKPRP
jgi:hypothetical protein